MIHPVSEMDRTPARQSKEQFMEDIIWVIVYGIIAVTMTLVY